MTKKKLAKKEEKPYLTSLKPISPNSGLSLVSTESLKDWDMYRESIDLSVVVSVGENHIEME